MTYTKKVLVSGEWQTVDPKAITENGEYPVDDVKNVSVDVDGGGGSSDLTTATVIVLLPHSGSGFSEPESGALRGLPVLADNDEYNVHGSSATSNAWPTSPYTVPLYKGKAYLWGDSSALNISSVSGDIAFDETLNAYVITGDCTITLLGQASDQTSS